MKRWHWYLINLCEHMQKDNICWICLFDFHCDSFGTRTYCGHGIWSSRRPERMALSRLSDGNCPTKEMPTGYRHVKWCIAPSKHACVHGLPEGLLLIVVWTWTAKDQHKCRPNAATTPHYLCIVIHVHSEQLYLLQIANNYTKSNEIAIVMSSTLESVN